MAQRRLRDYQDPLGSFEHNLINLGVHYPGRFAGYDTLVATGGLTFKITHVGKGIVTLDELGNPIGPFGVAMTNQGVVVIEDQEITALAVTANPSTSDRYDLLVMDHQYTLIAGGLPATYAIVPGIQGSETRGVLSPTQCILGTIRVIAGLTQASQLTYDKASAQDSGDMPDAKLDGVNTFHRLNEFAQSNLQPTNLVDAATTDLNALDNLKGKRWNLNYLGNTFSVVAFSNTDMDLIRLVGGSNQNGVEININTNDNLTIKHNTPPSPAEIAMGFATILIPDQWRDPITNRYKPPSPGANMLYTFLKVSGRWFLKNAVGVGVNTANAGNPGGGPKTATLVLAFINSSGFLSFQASLSQTIDGIVSIDRMFADGFASIDCSTVSITSAQKNSSLIIPVGTTGNSASPEITNGAWATALKSRMYNVIINGNPITNGQVLQIGSYQVTITVPQCN